MMWIWTDSCLDKQDRNLTLTQGLVVVLVDVCSSYARCTLENTRVTPKPSTRLVFLRLEVLTLSSVLSVTQMIS